MSAFMCNSETISFVALRVATIHQDYKPGGIYGDLGDLASSNVETIFKFLVEYNKKALVERYGDRDIESMIGNERKYDISKYITHTYDNLLFIMFKAFDCYLYQCAEGDYVNDNVYKYLESLQYRLAEEIVQKDSRYEILPWG